MITFDADEIVRTIAEGRYYEALGVPESADRLQIEGAAARLGDERQDIAQAVSGIVQLLTVPEKLAIYRIACQFRDAVIDDLRLQQLGADFLDPRRRAATTAWSSVQRLLRCDGEKGSVRIGPRAADDWPAKAGPGSWRKWSAASAWWRTSPRRNGIGVRLAAICRLPLLPVNRTPHVLFLRRERTAPGIWQRLGSGLRTRFP